MADTADDPSALLNSANERDDPNQIEDLSARSNLRRNLGRVWDLRLCVCIWDGSEFFWLPFGGGGFPFEREHFEGHFGRPKRSQIAKKMAPHFRVRARRPPLMQGCYSFHVLEAEGKTD